MIVWSLVLHPSLDDLVCMLYPTLIIPLLHQFCTGSQCSALLILCDSILTGWVWAGRLSCHKTLMPTDTRVVIIIVVVVTGPRPISLKPCSNTVWGLSLSLVCAFVDILLHYYLKQLGWQHCSWQICKNIIANITLRRGGIRGGR